MLDVVLPSDSDERPSGVRTPLLPLDLLAGLLTSGKLRVVPVDSKEETDGACGRVMAVELIGRRMLEYKLSRRVLPWP